MDDIHKINKLSDNLNLNNRGISRYGIVNGINIRISDHIPKFRNIQDYLPTLNIIDGKLYYIFIVISDDLIKIDIDEWSEECSDWLNDMLNIESFVKIEIFHRESIDVIKIYTEMLIDTIK